MNEVTETSGMDLQQITGRRLLTAARQLQARVKGTDSSKSYPAKKQEELCVKHVTPVSNFWPLESGDPCDFISPIILTTGFCCVV